MRIAQSSPDIDELQKVCELLVPWHAQRAAVAGVAREAAPANAPNRHMNVDE